MGLIRKTLMISTAGVVRGSSKKQRIAKASLNQLKQQTELMKEQERRERAEQAQIIQARRIPAPTGSHEQRKAELDRIRALANAPQRQAIAPVPVLPPQGWYPDADREHLLRYWDGSSWTEQTAPRA